MLDYFNTIEEIELSNPDTALIPIGSVEQHGSHLPIGTDYLIAKALSEEIAKRYNALLYPVIPFSNCYEHKGKKGSLGMKPSTLITLVQDLALNLRSQGFKKVIFLLSHGGAFALFPAVRELNALYDDLKVVVVTSAMLKNGTTLETSEELHAGEKETSIMLYLYEKYVKTEKMVNNDFIPCVDRSFLNYIPITKLSPTGVWGKPSRATAEKGRIFFELIVEGVIDHINKALEIAPQENWDNLK